MTSISLLLLAVAALMAFGNWRYGFFLVVLTGVLQDPLRKIAPGQPVYFVIFVGVVFAAVWLGAYHKGVPLGPKVMQGWSHFMRKPFKYFVVLVLLQALHSFVVFNNPVMTGIGLMVWLAPLPALVLAYQFALRAGWGGVQKWLLLYCVVAGLGVLGVYLEYSNFGWAVLGEVGEGLKIFDLGGVLKAYSGFFRSSEIAAWHTAATSAFVFILLTMKRFSGKQLIKALALVALLLSLGVLTGRRKMLIEVVFFISFFFLLIAIFQQRAGRLALGIAVAGLVAWASVSSLTNEDVSSSRQPVNAYQFDENSAFKGYAVRGQTGFDDVYNRFMDLGVAPITWSIASYGWQGAGLGTGSQSGGGVVSTQVNSGAAEGGLGKITMELGVPGLFLMGWLLLGLMRYLRWVLAETTRLSQPHARVAYGLVALLAAKGASFSMATQAYSDLFVLIMMGCSMGFLLAMPVLAARSRAAAPGYASQPVAPQRQGLA